MTDTGAIVVEVPDVPPTTHQQDDGGTIAGTASVPSGDGSPQTGESAPAESTVDA